MTTRSPSLALLIAIALLVMTAGPTRADNDFKVSITPYAWLISINGKVAARGYTTKVDKQFTSLASHINFAGMLAVDILAYERFGFTGNINAALLGDSSSYRGVSLDGESRMILSDLALFYRVGTAPLGRDAASLLTLDLFGGARIWDLRAKLDVDHPLQPFTVTQHETWVDPIIGGRARVRFNDTWGLELRGDIGGFDLNSRLTWGASSALAYTFWEHGTLLLGYRAVGVDYKTGSGSGAFKADGTLHGPLLGVSFRF